MLGCWARARNADCEAKATSPKERRRAITGGCCDFASPVLEKESEKGYLEILIAEQIIRRW